MDSCVDKLPTHSPKSPLYAVLLTSQLAYKAQYVRDTTHECINSQFHSPTHMIQLTARFHALGEAGSQQGPSWIDCSPLPPQPIHPGRLPGMGPVSSQEIGQRPGYRRGSSMRPLSLSRLSTVLTNRRICQGQIRKGSRPETTDIGYVRHRERNWVGWVMSVLISLHGPFEILYILQQHQNDKVYMPNDYNQLHSTRGQ